MHILIHPIWWNEAAAPGVETMARWLEARIDGLEDSMAANCTIYTKRGIAASAAAVRGGRA